MICLTALNWFAHASSARIIQSIKRRLPKRKGSNICPHRVRADLGCGVMLGKIHIPVPSRLLFLLQKNYPIAKDTFGPREVRNEDIADIKAPYCRKPSFKHDH